MLFNPKLIKANSLVKLSFSYISFIIARNRDLMKKIPYNSFFICYPNIPRIFYSSFIASQI
jgi:hypothetical protein